MAISSGMKRHVLALAGAMLLAGALVYGALVVLGGTDVGTALWQTVLVVAAVSAFLLYRLRRTGHL